MHSSDLKCIVSFIFIQIRVSVHRKTVHRWFSYSFLRFYSFRKIVGLFIFLADLDKRKASDHRTLCQSHSPDKLCWLPADEKKTFSHQKQNSKRLKQRIGSKRAHIFIKKLIPWFFFLQLLCLFFVKSVCISVEFDQN